MDRGPMLFLLLVITVGLPTEGLVAKSFFYRHAEGQRCGSTLATSLVSSLTGCAALCSQGNSALHLGYICLHGVCYGWYLYRYSKSTVCKNRSR